MPFKSDAQRRFMYATDPKLARRFSKHTPKGAKLPERVEKKADDAVAAYCEGLIAGIARSGRDPETELRRIGLI